LIGAANASSSNSTLIGSDQDDNLIDGAADGDADNDGEEDTFTGNAGEDLFSFNVSTSTPATFTSNTTTDAEDLEVINVTAADGDDEAASLITVEYELNNVTTVAVVNDTNAGFDIDFTDTASIAAGIAAVMNGINGITAVVDAVTNTQVNLEGDNGNLLNIGTITPNGAAGTAAAAADNLADDADDVAQITEVELTGTVTPGEIYFLTVTLRDGSEIEAQYEAQPADTLDLVAEGLINDALTGFNTLAPGTTIDATRAGAVITLTDEQDDDGGFDVSLSAGQAVLNGSSSSSVLDGTETSLDDADADVVTDFLDDDSIPTAGPGPSSPSVHWRNCS